MSPSPRPQSRAPRVGDLIDLELALEEDRAQPIEVLLARDARIASEIDAARLDDRALLLAWLARVRPAPSSPGRAVEGLLGLGTLLAIGAGAMSGSLAVAGWLWSGGGTPVNVVQLWPALVGVQVVLMLSWIGFRVSSRLVSSRASRVFEQGLSTWLPAAFGALATRFAGPGLREAWSRFRALDRVYHGLRFWRVTQLSQSFAVAFNAGALAALLLIPTVDDPAFGWRSRLMGVDAVEIFAGAVSAPWADVWPEAVPTREDIAATEVSSLASDRGETRPGHSGVWAAWWPFLVASFAVYGLLPRLVLWLVAALQTRGILRGVAFDHEGCVRLRERLRRPRVEGRAGGAPEGRAHAEAPGQAVAPLELPSRARALRWAGVPLEPDALATLLAREHGVVVDRVETAGGLDLAADARALDGLRDAPAVLAVVEAWEAPGTDYLDFLRKLRGALGERVPLLVLPCELGEDGRAVAVDPRHLALWRRQLLGLADPWLRVEPFPADRAS